jgi:hypothetical protein
LRSVRGVQVVVRRRRRHALDGLSLMALS